MCAAETYNPYSNTAYKARQSPYAEVYNRVKVKLPRKLKKRLKKQESRYPYRNSILLSASGRSALATALGVAYAGLKSGLLKDESISPFNGRFA